MISDLITTVTPPKSLNERGNRRQWAKIESEWGIPFPQDWFEYAQAYGSGRFYGGHILIYNPFGDRFAQRAKEGIEDLEYAAQSPHLDVPYKIFPESPGLFPLGGDENGGSIYWLTNENPDRWSIVLKEHGGDWEQRKMQLTEFLYKALTNQIRISIWDEFDQAELDFEPWLM